MTNAIGVGAITFLFTFGAAWLGTVIRAGLPPTHLQKESQDVVRLGMGLVATMTALLLGLVTAAAKSTFDSQDTTVRNSAVNILSLDRALARYGPETKNIRSLLRESVAYRLETIWATGVPAGSHAGFRPRIGAEAIEDQILQLTPTTEPQRWFRSQALSFTQDILKTRWFIFSSEKNSVPTAFLFVVIAWLTATFASFGLFAPRNTTVTIAFAVAALSVAAAVFLILELDSPFDGLIRITSGYFQYALENLGK